MSNGTALMGGSPFRVVRLSAAGARLLDRWLAGEALEVEGEAEQLRARLIRAGMVHPIVHPVETAVTAAFVVPVLDDVAGLERLLASVRRDFAEAIVVVVDDGSRDPEAIATVTDQYGAALVRHVTNQGPAAARNTGWRHIAETGDGDGPPDVTVFIDADVEPGAGALSTLLAHFADPDVAAVAPRIVADTGTDTIAAYEQHNSPLDMGADAAIVFPGTRLSFVPSALLALRTIVLDQAAGFEEGMRYGEDVDLVWRLVDAGHLIRYEPAAIATHRNRSSLAAFTRQRFAYGSSAAALAQRHGDKVAPLQLPAGPVVATLAMLFGSPIVRAAGLTGAVASAASLTRKLRGTVDEAPVEAARLTALTHGYAVQGLAAAATRSWAPLLLLTPKLRRALAASLVVPAMAHWVRNRPSLDPAKYLALRGIDHGSYCAGVWTGVIRSRSVAALSPKLRLRVGSERSAAR